MIKTSYSNTCLVSHGIRNYCFGLLLMACVMGVIMPAGAQIYAGAQFDGNTGFPFDSFTAVGPKHLVEVTYSTVNIFDKNGNLLMTRDIGNFFTNGVPQASTFTQEPHVLYDELAQRWLITAKSSGPLAWGPQGVAFAISDTSDPTQGWTETHTVHAADANPVGYNADAYVFTGPGRLSIVNKASVLDHDNNTYVVNETHASLVNMGNGPAHMPDSKPGDPFWICDNMNGANVFGWSISNILTAPDITLFSVNASGVNVDATTVATIRNKQWVLPGLGASGTNIQALLLSVSNAVPAVLQSASLNVSAAPGSQIVIPDATITPNGSIGIEYQFVSTNINGEDGIWVTGSSPGDPVNTLRKPLLIQPGKYSGWVGDFASIFANIAPDGTALNDFWGCNRYYTDTSGDWTARIFNFGMMPNAPIGVTGTEVSATQASLAWFSSLGTTNYNIYRSTTNGSGYAKVGNSVSTNYTDSDLNSGTTYYYVVTSVSQGLESGYSMQVNIQAGAPPPADRIDWDGCQRRRAFIMECKFWSDELQHQAFALQRRSLI